MNYSNNKLVTKHISALILNIQFCICPYWHFTTALFVQSDVRTMLFKSNVRNIDDELININR